MLTPVTLSSPRNSITCEPAATVNVDVVNDWYVVLEGSNVPDDVAVDQHREVLFDPVALPLWAASKRDGVGAGGPVGDRSG